MKVVVIADRIDPNGNPFKTSHIFDHDPVDVAGYRNAGLSTTDLENITKELEEYACNVHTLTITLTS